MKILKTGFTFDGKIDGISILKKIERAGRLCYKSEDKITEDSCIPFVKLLTHTYKHESVLEHASVSVIIQCDRGISHEVVRHRIGSYSQTSTRYCNYSKNKFNNEISVIWPNHLDNKKQKDKDVWVAAMEDAEMYYFRLLGLKWSAQEARGVLPTELATEIFITYNIRQWRNFFSLRCGPAAHPQLRELTIPMLKKFKELIPVLFDDFIIKDENNSASKEV